MRRRLCCIPWSQAYSFKEVAIGLHFDIWEFWIWVHLMGRVASARNTLISEFLAYKLEVLFHKRIMAGLVERGQLIRDFSNCVCSCSSFLAKPPGTFWWKGWLYGAKVKDCAQNSRIGLTKSLYSLTEVLTLNPFLLNPNLLMTAALVLAFSSMDWKNDL